MASGASFPPPSRGFDETSTNAPPFDRSPLDPPPTLVLFDLDDTLCDYASARDARLRQAFGGTGRWEEMDGRLDAMVADSIASDPHGSDHFPELFRRHGILDPERAQDAMAWYRRHRFHALRLHPAARETLAAVRHYRTTGGAMLPRGLGVITNGPAEIQRAKIELLGLDDLVDFCVVSGEEGVWKPDPRIFAEALRRGGTEAADAVFVGDSAEHDVAGARGAGIRPIWVDTLGRGWPGGPPPDRVVATIADVVPLLASVNDRPRRALGAEEKRKRGVEADDVRR